LSDRLRGAVAQIDRAFHNPHFALQGERGMETQRRVGACLSARLVDTAIFRMAFFRPIVSDRAVEEPARRPSTAGVPPTLAHWVH